MKKVTRTLEQIRSDINMHEAAIKDLKQEIKNFQAACPHPENFQNVTTKSYDDEYGRLEGYNITTTCLLCGHQEWEIEEVGRSRYDS